MQLDGRVPSFLVIVTGPIVVVVVTVVVGVDAVDPLVVDGRVADVVVGVSVAVVNVVIVDAGAVIVDDSGVEFVGVAVVVDVSVGVVDVVIVDPDAVIVDVTGVDVVEVAATDVIVREIGDVDFILPAQGLLTPPGRVANPTGLHAIAGPAVETLAITGVVSIKVDQLVLDFFDPTADEISCNCTWRN